MAEREEVHSVCRECHGYVGEHCQRNLTALYSRHRDLSASIRFKASIPHQVSVFGSTREAYHVRNRAAVKVMYFEKGSIKGLCCGLGC